MLKKGSTTVPNEKNSQHTSAATPSANKQKSSTITRNAKEQSKWREGMILY